MSFYFLCKYELHKTKGKESDLIFSSFQWLFLMVRNEAHCDYIVDVGNHSSYLLVSKDEDVEPVLMRVAVGFAIH